MEFVFTVGRGRGLAVFEGRGLATALWTCEGSQGIHTEEVGDGFTRGLRVGSGFVLVDEFPLFLTVIRTS